MPRQWKGSSQVLAAALPVLAILALAQLLAAAAAPNHPGPGAVDAHWLSEHYQKLEVMLAMRDGVELYTAIYAPRDAGEPAPILLHRTPYSCRPYGEGRMPEVIYPDPLFAREGYVLVCQDVRGTHRSQGRWVHMRPPRTVDPARPAVDESTDTYDTIDWLIRNVPRSNQRVCLWGASYPGFYVAASMIESHPALVCAMPQAPQIDWWHEDVHHNGAFFLAPVVAFLVELGGPRPGPVDVHPRLPFRYPTRDGYRFFLDEVGGLADLDARVFGGAAQLWRDLVAHPDRDAFWEQRDLAPHLRSVPPAVLTVGGWYDDSNLYGTLAAYGAVERLNPGHVNLLAIGPWEHTGWEWEAVGDRHGDIPFGAPTSQLYRLLVQKPFLDFYARGVGPDRDGDGAVDLPEAWMFEVGANRWRSFSAWPPPNRTRQRLYLRQGSALSWDPPPTADAAGAPSATASTHDSFRSDPRRPVPFTERVVPGRDPAYMTADQRFASRRPDVLVYWSAVLVEPLTLAGPLTAELWVSTDRADADWVVKLIDVFPGSTAAGDWAPRERPSGYEMLVRAEVARGRYREDPSRPLPFVPDEPTRLTFALPDVLHTFLPGHRLMVQVQSSWFPLVDRNPQAWVDNIYRARDQDFAAATHRLYRTATHPSRLEVGVLPTQPLNRTPRAASPPFAAPAWSADGEWITFVADLEATGTPRGWMVHRLRAGIHRAPESLVRSALPPPTARSPDGSTLAFGVERPGTTQLHLMDAEGGARRPITAFSGVAGWPSWSPDGNWIAFVGEDDGRWGVFVVAADGSQLRSLTSGL